MAPTKTAVMVLAVLGGAAMPATAAELLSTHSDWKVYRHSQGREPLCFAVSAASEQKPGDGDRARAYVYVTAWPRQGIKAEVSVNLGLPLEKGAEVTVEVSGNSFTLLADGDRAYAGDGDAEQRLLDAMRRGKVMTISATAADGTATRDAFSLAGVTASVAALAQGCN